MSADVATLHGAPARFAGGLVDLAPNTCAWLQPNGDWGESNAGLVIGDGTAALIDTAWDLPLTRRILGAAARRTAAPVETLVVTHADGDHVNGCGLVAGARMYASADAARELADEHPRGLRASQLGCGVLRHAAVGPPRRFGRYVAAMLDPFDFRGVEIRMPDTTFVERLELDIGGRAIELRHLGSAHTAGDTVVLVPDVHVVFAGDLVFRGVTPNAWAGPIGSWRDALEQLLMLAPDHVVPGHGPVTDVAGVAELDRYWAWLETRALRLLAAGHDVDATAERIVLSDEFAAEPWGAWLSPERTLLNVVVIDRTRRRVPCAISHRERPRLMWRVARLAARIEAARS